MPCREKNDLFSAYTLGDLKLPNRIVMASLGRSRVEEGGIPPPLMAEYYSQRASAGLIITEGTSVSAKGLAYDGMPGISTQAQIAGWELLTHAVHTCGGRIFLQLCHVGRISHRSLEPMEQFPSAPSALLANAQVSVNGRELKTSAPRALEIPEIQAIIEAYVLATRNALWAGCDGVEIQAGEGFLIDQFLCDGSNERDDQYGGTVANRLRFLKEIVTAVIAEASEDRVGVRLSPFSVLNDAYDSDPSELFTGVVTMLDALRPVYLHVDESAADGRGLNGKFLDLRRRFHRTYIAHRRHSCASAMAGIASGATDLVSFGAEFIANPDLVERMRANASLSIPDPATLWGGGAAGYTDYLPMLRA